MRILSYVMMAIVGLGLTSCKSVEIVDGQIPAEYFSLAQSLEGKYVGQFNNEAATLTFRLNGLSPELSFLNSKGSSDWLPGCHSQVGLLKRIYVSTLGSERIATAQFAFDPGFCSPSFEGRTLNLEFRDNSQAVKVWVLESRTTHVSPGFGDNSDTLETIENRVEGKFQRLQ
jgi:hypothetical protein